ncbi:MAG: PP2C family protein-serine/threonine phosphatase [Chloroflexota bacterium]
MQRFPLTYARVVVTGAAAAAVFVAWLVTGSEIRAGVTYFYAVPVGLAAWWWGRRVAVAVVLACIALYLIGVAVHPVPDLGVALSLRLAALTGVAIVVSLVQERLTTLEHSAEDLETIRSALTPAALPRLPGVDAATAFVPSQLGLSGDFYLVTDGSDGSVVAIVGDVTGHGPKAARLATFVRARFAAFAAGTGDPAELLMLVNEALADRPGGELVSAACLRLDGARSHLTWAVAGHPPPLVLPALRELVRAGNTLPLGADDRLELRNGEASLAPGGGVVAYTDGATEVRRNGAMLGADGLARLLEPLAGLPAGELVARAEAAILEWADAPIRDDLCLLAMRPVATPERESP